RPRRQADRGLAVVEHARDDPRPHRRPERRRLAMRRRRATVLSPCRAYRYVLWRTWGGVGADYAAVVRLNPSSADEKPGDPTVRRCVGFARRWGYGALCLVNLFALRATDPAALKAHAAPVGPDNDRWLIEAARGAAVVVAAWGAGGAYLGRGETVARLLGGG